MSLPSVKSIIKERAISLDTSSPEQREEILVEAMRRDLPLAVDFLHRKSHEAEGSNGRIDWDESPNSVLGKQLIRIHASDAMRPLASKHFCHGKMLSFVNCCRGAIGTPPTDIMMLQIKA